MRDLPFRSLDAGDVTEVESQPEHLHSSRRGHSAERRHDGDDSVNGTRPCAHHREQELDEHASQPWPASEGGELQLSTRRRMLLRQQDGRSPFCDAVLRQPGKVLRVVLVRDRVPAEGELDTACMQPPPQFEILVAVDDELFVEASRVDEHAAFYR